MTMKTFSLHDDESQCYKGSEIAEKILLIQNQISQSEIQRRKTAAILFLKGRKLWATSHIVTFVRRDTLSYRRYYYLQLVLATEIIVLPIGVHVTEKSGAGLRSKILLVNFHALCRADLTNHPPLRQSVLAMTYIACSA